MSCLDWLKHFFHNPSQSTKTEKQIVGAYGEKMATKYLRKKGYKILERNFVAYADEIDIIARDAKNKHMLVFVEVKTRQASDDDILRFGHARRAVNARKRTAILRAARNYRRRLTQFPYRRYDIIEVYLNEDKKVRDIQHILYAFHEK